MARSSNDIDAIAFSATVFGIVLLNKLASFLTPYKLYFSFSSFLFNQSSIFRWQSLALKLLLPALFAFVFYVAAFRFMLLSQSYGKSGGGTLLFLRDSAERSLKLGSLFAAILLAWPFLVYWDILIEPNLRDKKLPFIFAYLFYFAAYYFFAGFGIQLAKVFLGRTHKNREILATGDADFSWLSPLRDGVSGAVTAMVATYVTAVAASG